MISFIRHLLFSYIITHLKIRSLYEKKFNETNVTFIDRFINVFQCLFSRSKYE